MLARHRTPSMVFLKPTVSSMPSASASDLHTLLPQIQPRLTLHTTKKVIHLLTYDAPNEISMMSIVYSPGAEQSAQTSLPGTDRTVRSTDAFANVDNWS